MQKLFKNLKQYPLVVLFFAFIALVAVVDTLLPDKERSEYENRRLQQAPAFNVEAFLDNEWTLRYADYVKDQFLGRDGWITLQSALETAQGKLEANGVWYAKDGYQIAKQEWLSDNQQRLLQTNARAVAELAARHEGIVTAVVVPSPANVLADKLRYNPPKADENTWLDDIFTQWQMAGASVLDLRSLYAAHDEEALFYRTDHHWTTRGGAWLAYQALGELRGFTATEPQAQLVQVQDFYGTSYAKTKKPGTQPDVLEYYDVPNTLTVYSYTATGALEATPGPVMDVERLAEYDKYAAFLRGNNGFSELEGNGEGSILLIKDSYGNCFAPYLVENYARIGIVDLRSWATSIDNLIEAYGYDEILVLYCFESFSTDTNIYRLQDESQT